MFTFNNLSKQLEINHYQFLLNMKKLLKSLSSVLFLVILISNCGPDNSFIGQAEKGISSKDYNAALAAIDSALALDANNTEAYFLRARAYGEMAVDNPNVGQRIDSYKKMKESIDKVKELKSTTGNDEIIIEPDLSRENNYILTKWGQEHNAAVQYATGDTSVAQVSDPLGLAADHLNNAVTINPDSVLSFEVLSEVYRLSQDYEGAIRTLKKAMDLKSTPSAFDYSNLGSYYMLTDDYNSAVGVLEKGTEQYPDSVQLVQKLADSYSRIGDNDNAIKTLESLLERDPDNAQYHLVLATQVYLIVSDISDQNSALHDQRFDLKRSIRDLRGSEKQEAENRIKSLDNEIQTKQSEIDELTLRVIKELDTVLKLRPDDATAYNTLGIVYQNKAANLFEQRNATSDNDEAAELDTRAKDQLRNAMTNYEKAAEISPENTSYWEALFRVYTTLGMNDKAEEAMKKAGM